MLNFICRKTISFDRYNKQDFACEALKVFVQTFYSKLLDVGKRKWPKLLK